MVASQLRQKRHRLLSTLGDQLAVHPVQRMGKGRPLAAHVRREQVAWRNVERKPARVKPADEPVFVVRVDGSMQYRQCIPVVEAHARRSYAGLSGSRYSALTPLWSTIKPITSRIAASNAALFRSIQSLSRAIGSLRRSPAPAYAKTGIATVDAATTTKIVAVIQLAAMPSPLPPMAKPANAHMVSTSSLTITNTSPVSPARAGVRVTKGRIHLGDSVWRRRVSHS